ncbi:recombinase family protein [Haloferax sp. YSSS75]|uniref:recombinase family protein n=1 Tax=Haloferax sp. YSSS75 TaxID=3388564 RepID=UPI00398D38C2
MSELHTVFSEYSGQSNASSESKAIPRAAIYARTSSASQQFGYSIDEQVRQCIARCNQFGWKVHFVFRDEAVSGANTDRPMFSKMLNRAEAGDFDVLVFWKLDRFSRSIMHVVELEEQFSDWGVALHSVTEQLDTTNPTGRFNFRNLANAAELERELIKQRTTMGHIARAMEHKWPNTSPPLGYEVTEDGFLKVAPSEAVLVRRIFREYVELESMPEVARQLNRDGRLGRSGKKWTPSTIGTILRNEIYIGRYSIRGVHAWVDEYRILSDATFEKVTTIRTRFRTNVPSTRPEMSKKRKRETVMRIIEKYSNYIR